MKIKPAFFCFLAVLGLGFFACKNKHKKQEKEEVQDIDRYLNAPLKGVDAPGEDSLPANEGDTLSTLPVMIMH